MSPIKRLFSVVGVLMAFVAIVAVASAGATTDVPFKGTNNVVVTITGQTSPNPYVYDFTASGGGEATQVGQFTYQEEGTINFATNEIAGTWTYIAANSDTLTGTYTADSSAPTITVQIEGGTGRFAGATGEITIHLNLLTATATTATYKNTLTGTISTVGSG